MNAENAKNMENREHTGKCLSVRKTLRYMIIFMMLVSVLLLVATSSVSKVNSNLNDNLESYKQWQKDANNLQLASDYLTEQVRCFVVTGDRTYLDNYFEEANVTKRRDHALESVKRLKGESEAYTSLVNAMAESLELMDREFYAMRLAISGFGLNVSEFPQQVQDVELSVEDLADTPEKQRETAGLMVCDDTYHSKKQSITNHIQECLTAMDAHMEASQLAAQNQMKTTIRQQRLMIFASIAAMIGTNLMITQTVIWPLLKAVTYIQKDLSIPVEGSEEFQFLVREYNVAHRTNVEKKQELAYEATHDNLTGVYNRNGYESIRQSVDWSHSALVLFDLDKFKPVNDKYGHKMGDRVLSRTAQTIQNAFRAQDYVCRIGGDEFAVIMVSVTTDTSDTICEKVRRINEALLRPQDDIPGIHISSGAAYGALIPDFDIMFREADAALYRVKNNGGGGCEVVLKSITR